MTLAAATVLLLGALAGPQPGSTPRAEAGAGLAPTPGSVMLLLAGPDAPDVHRRWAEALRDARSLTRAAAARAVLVSGSADLLGDVRAALRQETDIEAATEEVGAIAQVGGAGVAEELLAVARSFGGRLDKAVVTALARARGEEAVAPCLAAQRDLHLTTDDLVYFFRVASRGRRDGLCRAAAPPLRDGDARAWKALLGAARKERLELDRGLLLAGLMSPSAAIRDETGWDLAEGDLGDVRAHAEAFLEALAATAESGGDPAEAESGFGRELLARRLGRAPVESPAWMEGLGRAGASRVDDADQWSAIAPSLTAAERKAAEARRARLDLPAPVPAAADPPLAPIVRTVSGFPRGLVGEVLRTSGCKLADGDRVLTFDAAFGADGRSRTAVRVDPDRADDCQRAARALFAASLVDADNLRGERPETLVLPLNRKFASCVEEDDACSAPDCRPDRGHRSGKLDPPREIERVKPIHPGGARQAGERGMVILGAWITANGCVRDVHVLRGLERSLDLSALEAVTRWRFAPARLDGRPVPVYFALTVNYR